MIKDITIGQFYPGDTIIHRLDSRVKLISTVLYIVMLFSAPVGISLFMGIALFVAIYPLSRLPIKLILKNLKPILPIIILTILINVFFASGDIIYTTNFFHISRQGIILSIVMSARIVCLIAFTSLLTYTTSPIDLTDGLERLLSPLKKLNMPIHELSMMMTIALRFIPTLIEEADKIMSAQKARGASIDSGNIKKRIEAIVPVLVPLFVSAFRRADELAMAMECRCYRGGVGRTRANEPKLKWQDFACLIIIISLTTLTFVLGIIFPMLGQLYK